MQPGHDNTIGNRKFPAGALVTRRQALGLALVAGAGGLLLVACGGSATATSAPAAVATTAPVPTTAPTAATTAATGARATTTAATKAELTAAFQAAGIPTPDRWAQEVTEYRPYPTDDPTFAKLRSNLAKYNPAPEVVNQIIATLSLS